MDAKRPLSKARFGPFEADFVRCELRKLGTRLRLQGKPLALLAILARTPGETVTREELREELWADNVFVDFDRNLATTVNKLRVALGDRAENPLYIETVPRIGFRFIGQVEILYGEALLPVDLTGGETLLDNESSSPPPTATESAEDGRGRWSFARNRRFASAAAIILVIVIAAAGTAWMSARSKPQASGSKIIAVADLTNSTGDPVLGVALRQLLSAQLGKSPSLVLLTDTKIAQMLSLMEKKPGTPLVPSVAREICIRSGGSATIEGSIDRLGTQYALTLRAVACKTGEVVAREERTAGSQEGILSGLRAAAASIRQELDNPAAQMPKSDLPAQEVTTTSLEALEAYGIGYQILQVENNSHPAIPFFQRAIQLDPNFAMAYAVLGRAYDCEDEDGLAAQSFVKAHELRELASEREKSYIDAYYEYIVEGRLEQAARSFTLWAEMDPANATPHASLGNIYYELGQFDRSILERQIALKLDPNTGLHYGNLAAVLVASKRFEEARAISQQASARNLDSPELHLVLAWAAWAEGRPDEREKQLASVRRDPIADQWALQDDALIAAFHGQFERSRVLVNAVSDQYRRADLPEAIPAQEANAAIRESLVGNFDQSRKFAYGALALDKSRDIKGKVAIALALSGRSRDASRLAAELVSEAPDATVVSRNFLPSIRAAIALESGRPDEAVKSLEPASPYDSGTLGYPYLPTYLRGKALLAMSDNAHAIEEFTKLLNGPAYEGRLVSALAQLQLARAQTLSGDLVRGKASYQNFLNLWKQADISVPLLQAAKIEYAKCDRTKSGNGTESPEASISPGGEHAITQLDTPRK